MYSFCAMYSFRMSFWMVPEIFRQSAPCFSATARYMAHNTDAGELIVIETVVFSRSMPSKRISLSSREWLVNPHLDRVLLQVDAVKKNLHIFERIDGHPALADFSFAHHVVAVVAHQRGQVESYRQPLPAVRQQVLVRLVC